MANYGEQDGAFSATMFSFAATILWCAFEFTQFSLSQNRSSINRLHLGARCYTELYMLISNVYIFMIGMTHLLCAAGAGIYLPVL